MTSVRRRRVHENSSKSLNVSGTVSLFLQTSSHAYVVEQSSPQRETEFPKRGQRHEGHHVKVLNLFQHFLLLPSRWCLKNDRLQIALRRIIRINGASH